MESRINLHHISAVCAAFGGASPTTEYRQTELRLSTQTIQIWFEFFEVAFGEFSIDIIEISKAIMPLSRFKE